MSETIFRPGGNCCAVAQAARATMLVDGEAYFDAFVRFAERAERSLVIVAWDFDSRTVLRFGEDGRPALTMGEFLNALCRRKPKLRVKILDWDFPMVFGTDREYSPIFGLNWQPHRHIEFRFDDTHPLAGSHHQKIVAIDDKVAFAGGLDITSKRWDSPAHAPGDPRRRFEDKDYPPFHDVMVAVDGEAGRALADIARARWKTATGHRLKAVSTRGDPWPPEQRVDFRDVRVAISCTTPPVNGHPDMRQVESLYVDMIARARRYIYIENQYFTSEKVGEALERRLADADGPEIVLATRLLSHGWLEEATMSVLRTRLVRRLREADRHGRFHAYYPHVEGLAEGTCLDLHSKVMVVDDEWLRIGSSNLSNRSMGVDTECDVTIEAGGDERVRRAIREARDRLLAEHCGVEMPVLQAALAGSASIAAAVATVGSPQRRLRELEAPEVSEALMAAAAVGDMEQPISLDALMADFASDDAPPVQEPPSQAPYALVGIIATFAALALAWRYTPLAGVVTPERVLGVIESFARHWWVPLALMLAYTPASVVMFPRPLITFAAVVTFGPWEGLAYAMAGVVLAGVAGYAAGRLLHRDTARRLAGPRLTRLSGILQRRGVIAVALVRLVPIAPYVVVNVVMGAMRIRLRDFVAGTFLGMLPGALAATVLSDQIAVALQDPGNVNGWLLAAGVLGIAGLAVFGHRMLRRMDGGKSAAATPPSYA